MAPAPEFDFNGLVHLEDGNFAGNAFFAADNDNLDLDVHTLDDSTPELDASSSTFADLDHTVESLAFVKSNAFITIADNDTAFVEVTAKEKGDDDTNSVNNTGFNVTLRQPDGSTATTSDTDTTVSFNINNTATPFLGAQTSSGGSIDSFPGAGFGGALNWAPTGPLGLPQTIVNGLFETSGGTFFSFTVLNDGDFVSIAINEGTIQLSDFDGNAIDIAVQNFSGELDAGTYFIQVDGPFDDQDSFTLDVVVENHLIADYQLTSEGNNLTSIGDVANGEWEVTIPANQESIMVVVDVFNDTQVEDLEDVSLWLGSVTDGDADVSTGLIYFADDTFGDNNAGIGRVDVGGGNLIKLIETALTSASDPFGVSIDQAEGKIYWTDQDPGRQGIFRANLDGSNVETVLLITADVEGAVEPRGLEVVGDFVYFVDESTAELHRIRKDGTGTIEDLLDLPVGSNLDDVSVDLVNEKVYFVDDGPVPNDTISRANLDGTNIETVIQFSDDFEGSPQAIALDVAGGKLYWTDDATNSIRRANLDGTNIETVSDADSLTPDGIALDLINGFVYWNNSEGLNSILRAPLEGGAAETVADVTPLDGIQDLRHLDLLIPTQIHATAEICDHDEAVVFVSTDNTRAEAEVDPATEPGTEDDDHKEIIISLRDVNGTPVTAQDQLLVSYLYDALSTATNGQDHIPLGPIGQPASSTSPGFTTIPAGMSSVPLADLDPSIFVLNDSQLEGDEDVVIKLSGTIGDPQVSVIASNADNEDTAFVIIEDDESATVIVEAIDNIAKERDGIEDGPEEVLDPGVFRFTQSESSTSDTTVTFELDTPTDAETSDYTLSAPMDANLTLVSPGVYELTIPANQTEIEVTVNVIEDVLIELDEVVAIKITDISSATNADVSIGSTDSAQLTIFDDDIGKVIITAENAFESTQPGVSPGTSGQFKIALVDPITGLPVISETATQVRVILNEAIPDSATFSATTDTNDGDFTIVEIVTPTNFPASPRFAIIDFPAGANMVLLDVELIEETPALDLGDEFVKLSLDQNFGITTDDRFNDGVVGDAQILLDQTPSLIVAGDQPHVVFAIDVSGSVSEPFGGTSVGDVNGDGSSDTILDAELAALIALNQSFVNSGETIQVSIVIFGNVAASLDLSTDAGQQIIVNADADSNGNNIADIEELLAQITEGGGGLGLEDGIFSSGGGGSIPTVGSDDTNFVNAVDAIESVITSAGTTPDNANVVFLSDGDASISASDVIDLQFASDNVQAFGVRFGDDLGSSLDSLDIIDTDDAFEVTSSDQLLTFFGLASDPGALVSNGELVYTFAHPNCPDIVVDGMAMDMATVTIIDEQFKINIAPNEENAAEPGTSNGVGPGNNGQFAISISNPWQFGDTIVNFSVTGTADFLASGDSDDSIADYVLSSGAANNLVFDPVTGQGQITILQGQSEALLDVQVNDDEVIEFDSESVIVTLTGLDNEATTFVENLPMVGNVRMLGDMTDATVNIFDDDSALVTPSVTVATASEPVPGAVSSTTDEDNGQFTLTLLESGTPVTSDTATEVEFTLSGTAKLDTSGLESDFSGFDYQISVDAESESEFNLTHVSGNTFRITIPANTPSISINLVTLNDFVLEGDETAILTVDRVVTGDLEDISVTGSSTITIEDTDEGEVQLVALDPVGQEDGGLGSDAALAVRLIQQGDTSANPQRLVSDTDTEVTFALDSSSTATLGSDFDFDPLTTTVTIDAFTGTVPDLTSSVGSDGEAIIPVNVLPDVEIEATETVVVNATAVSGDPNIEVIDPLAQPTATASIQDNDSGTVSLIVSDDTAGEPGDDGQFQVVLSEMSSTPTEVGYTILFPSTTATLADDDPLTDTDDFTLNGSNSFTGTVTIPAGDLTANIDLNVIDNDIQEGNETVSIRINSVSGDPQISIDTDNRDQTITITDEDVPTFTVVNETANEGDGTIDFDIVLSQPIDVDVDVFLRLTNGTASQTSELTFDDTVGNQDFQASALGNSLVSATFDANGVNGLTRTISIPINNDIFVEADEVFTAQLIIDGASLPNTLNQVTLDNGRLVNIEDDQDGTEFGQGVIENNDEAVFTITGILEDDPEVIEGTNSDPYGFGTTFSTTSFLVELSNPIDVDVDVDVNFGRGTATGVVFGNRPNSGTDLPFGTDFDSEMQTLTFEAGEFGINEDAVVVRVVQDRIVEGGDSSILPSFGSENFIASLEASASDLDGRPVNDSDESTATILDRDESENDDSADQAKVTVTSDPNVSALADNQAAEPDDNPFFDTGTYVIRQSEPSSTPTTVRFQITGDADFELSDFTLSTELGENLTNLGDGLYSVDIPASIGDTPITEIDIILNPVSDDIFEDDEQATLTLVDINGVDVPGTVDGDPEVMLDTIDQSATIQVDGDDEGLLQVTVRSCQRWSSNRRRGRKQRQVCLPAQRQSSSNDAGRQRHVHHD